MKKTGSLAILISIIILIALFVAWKFLGPAVSEPGGEFFYIRTGSDMEAVKKELLVQKMISSTFWFDKTATLLHYKNIKPGRYKISKKMSLVSFVRKLRSGDQTPIQFVITKLRLPENLAGKVGANFECDSLQMIRFIKNNDSLKAFGLDTNTVMSVVMPYTYPINWNTTPKKIFQHFYTAYKTFWNNERKARADSLGLTPIQVSTLASIIEEETNLKSDKPLIASVYLNRLETGMPLQADPTVKFALKDFQIKRVLHAHLEVKSSYNTYLNKGLPPGPICTPSISSIEAVLEAPKTNYLYFVASSNFDGSSVFSATLAEHQKNAKAYQRALTKLLSSNKK